MNDIATYIAGSLRGLYSPEELKSLILIVCRDLLGLNEVDIYLRKDTKLSENKQLLLEQVVERLKRNEPIQYVRGTADFCGMSLQVSPPVLIPRPETEELVGLILEENPGAAHILDIGTGSGCIAIALSRWLPQAVVDAWDVSEEALAVARRNNEIQQTRVRFYLRDVFDEEECDKQYHIVVSNPPYVTEKEKEAMDENVLGWEPSLALFVPDDDPLCFYRRIARITLGMLHEGGKLYFEINRAYSAEVAAMLQELGYVEVRIVKDLFGNDRFIKAIR